MSTTRNTAHQPFSASGQLSLTERRKAETRMEIARAAARLFVHQGLRATRAEDIAHAAGIAPRTFYRYFASKEEAVAPLYAAGARRWAEAVRTAPAHLTVPEALEHAVTQTFTPGAAVSSASWEWVRTLIRLAVASPALRKVWAEVCQTSETTLAEIFATRLASAGAGTTQAGADGAERAGEGSGGGLGEGSGEGPGERGGEGPGERVGEGSGERGGEGSAERVGEGSGEDNVADGSPPSDPTRSSPPRSGPTPLSAPSDPSPSDPPPLTPGLRFAAAVAGAAVRVAVESWAVTTASPTGPQGPAALALRNLRALRDFEWDGAN